MRTSPGPGAVTSTGSTASTSGAPYWRMRAARSISSTFRHHTAAVVMIANQVLRSLRFFFTDQSQGAALVPAADSVAAWRFQTLVLLYDLAGVGNLFLNCENIF